MKKLSIPVLSLLFVFIAFAAYAGEFAPLKKKMLEARYSLYVMLNEGDKRGPEQQERVKQTAEAVSAMLAGMKAPAGKEARFKELDATWKAFKKTREEELVPLILDKKQKEAEQVATGIQNDRFKKLMDLCDELDQ